MRVPPGVICGPGDFDFPDEPIKDGDSAEGSVLRSLAEEEFPGCEESIDPGGKAPGAAAGIWYGESDVGGGFDPVEDGGHSVNSLVSSMSGTPGAGAFSAESGDQPDFVGRVVNKNLEVFRATLAAT